MDNAHCECLITSPVALYVSHLCSRENFPFSLIADEGNREKQYKYRPRPDVALLKKGFPRFLAVIDSTDNVYDMYRLYVFMACALRLALALRKEDDGCNGKDFFLMGASLSRDWHIYRYFFYVDDKGKVCMEAFVTSA